MILDTSTSWPNLTGIIPIKLCQVAGKRLQEDCTKQGNGTTGQIYETEGHGLQCKKVYHYYMPAWTSAKNGGQEVCLFKLLTC